MGSEKKKKKQGEEVGKREMGKGEEEKTET